MYPIKTIAYKEFITGIRDKTFFITGLLLTLLLMAAVLTGVRNYQRETQVRQQAAHAFRQQWLHQAPKHPHIAAHFGNFAVMPMTALSFFDTGLDAFTGKVVYLEPHKQNDFSFKPSEEQDSSLRFGELSMALILQLLFPLMIIFSSFNAFTRERESGNLKMLYSHGLSFAAIFAGKFTGRMLTVLLLFAPCLLLLVISSIWIPTDPLLVPHIGVLLLLYLLYLSLFTALSILVSAIAVSSRTAVLSLLTLWIVMTILLPKWSANAGNDLYPLPTKYEFNAAIRADIDKGINGHDPKSARAESIKKELLEKYQVDTISKLPFNYEGYIMQAGEEYSSMVYDKHFARLQNTLDKQNQLSLWASVIDPYMAIRNLSMALCGTDFYTHQDFQQQAEQYRRQFVQQMNGDMKDHSATGDWSYKANAAVFVQVPSFRYKHRSFSASLSHYTAGFASFLIWLVVISGAIYYCNKKN